MRADRSRCRAARALGLAAALLAAGDRDEARMVLPELWTDAKRWALGGRGGRGPARAPAPDPAAGGPGIQPLDILTSVSARSSTYSATGATNRAIAERLFISQKTVSVHVTNLMAKLGVTNRARPRPWPETWPLRTEVVP